MSKYNYLKKAGQIKKNRHAPIENKLLYNCMSKLHNILLYDLKLKDEWEIEHNPTLSMKELVNKLIIDGVDKCNINYLLQENKNGNISKINPDGGIISLVKRNKENEIVIFYPLVISEMKHQGNENKEENSVIGNAIERVTKNYNVIEKLCWKDKVTPFVCFCQGKDMSDIYMHNKLRQGINEINEYNICNDSDGFRHCQIWVREKEWDENEIMIRLKSCAEQAFNFYKDKMI